MIWTLGILTATVIAFPEMTPAKALTVLGLGSVAIGFAFKDIFENFFAGMLILWKYPFDRSVEGVRTIEVFAEEFGSSSINFEVAWWTGSKPIDIRRSRDEVVAAIKRELDRANIEIPFPYRTLTYKDAAVRSAIESVDREAESANDC